MRASRSVRVYPHEVKPGDGYTGYASGSTHCFVSITVSSEGIPLQWGEDPIERQMDYFERDMTWKEEAEWYRNQIDMTNSANQLNLMDLHTDLSSVGDAFHEMWNGWVKCDWCEQLVELVDEDFFIAGIAEAPYGCWAIDDAIALKADVTALAAVKATADAAAVKDDVDAAFADVEADIALKAAQTDLEAEAALARAAEKANADAIAAIIALSDAEIEEAIAAVAQA